MPGFYDFYNKYSPIPRFGKYLGASAQGLASGGIVGGIKAGAGQAMDYASDIASGVGGAARTAFLGPRQQPLSTFPERQVASPVAQQQGISEPMDESQPAVFPYETSDGSPVAAQSASSPSFVPKAQLPVGTVSIRGGQPMPGYQAANIADQYQANRNFLGSGQFSGGGTIGGVVGRAREAATNAIQQQGKGAAAMYGIRRANEAVPYSQAEMDKQSVESARRSGGSMQYRQQAVDKAQGEINMRNARQMAVESEKRQLASGEAVARSQADAMAAKVGAGLEGKRLTAQAQLMGRIYAANAGLDAAKMANEMKASITAARTQQEAAKAALDFSAKSGLPVIDEKGQTTPLGEAVKQFASVEFGQTDQGIQQTQVKEAPGIAAFDSDQSGDIDTPAEMDAAQTFMTKVMTMFNGMTPEQQAKQKLTNQYILAQAIQQRMKKKANDEAARLVQ